MRHTQEKKTSEINEDWCDTIDVVKGTAQKFTVQLYDSWPLPQRHHQCAFEYQH